MGRQSKQYKRKKRQRQKMTKKAAAHLKADQKPEKDHTQSVIQADNIGGT